jgi:hypothetical protein
MKYISDVEEWEEFKTHPKYIAIYSSSTFCAPCKQLKKWIESEYPFQERIAYINVDLPELDSITNHIFALPTIIYHSESVDSKIEGYKKEEIRLCIEELEVTGVTELKELKDMKELEVTGVTELKELEQKELEWKEESLLDILKKLGI